MAAKIDRLWHHSCLGVLISLWLMSVWLAVDGAHEFRRNGRDQRQHDAHERNPFRGARRKDLRVGQWVYFGGHRPEPRAVSVTLALHLVWEKNCGLQLPDALFLLPVCTFAGSNLSASSC